jgi:hypothetical protein
MGTIARYHKVLHEDAGDFVVDGIAVALDPVRRQIVDVVHDARIVLVEEAAELIYNSRYIEIKS